jgi:DegV family protein with EDD domain
MFIIRRAKMVKFIADSSSDLLEMQGVYFESVPLTIYSDEFSYTDDHDIDIKEMLDKLEKYKGRSYTACPSAESWLNVFEGSEEIYVLTMTSALSGTYNSAAVAREMYLQKHPDVKIHIFDTLSTGPEMRLLLEKLVELKKDGFSFEEVCKRAEKYLAKTRLFFSFQSLHNLAQNGRVNKVLASAIGALGISVFGTASTAGMIEAVGKCRGDKKVIATFLKQMKAAGFKNGKVRIGHIENEKLAKKLHQVILEVYPKADVLVYPSRGLCSYYGERGCIMLGCEGSM